MRASSSQSPLKLRRLSQIIAALLFLACSLPLRAQPGLVHSYQAPGERPPRIALTFDDGPSAAYTPQILDIFAQHNGRCTLFALGSNVSGHKQILRRAEAEGHEIGIHSWGHASYTGLSTGSIQADLRRCQAALNEVAERPVRWMRPPYGNIDARVQKTINDAGYRVAMWSVDPLDWRRPGSGVIASHILSKARDGAIVVLHDGGGNRAGTVAAMRKVVPELKRRGFELVTLSELTGLVEPHSGGRVMRLVIGDAVFEIAAAPEEVKVTVDGMGVELSEPPVIIDGRYLVQARPVLAALGASVTWDAETSAITFDGARGEFVVKLDTLGVTLDGEALLVQTPSIYRNGTAMLPARLIATARDVTVRWNSEERTIEFVTTSRLDRQFGAPGQTPAAPPQRDATRIMSWVHLTRLNPSTHEENFTAI